MHVLVFSVRRLQFDCLALGTLNRENITQENNFKKMRRQKGPEDNFNTPHMEMSLRLQPFLSE
eukprot:scaffold186196_cov20-Cyclotella_meneghiniana.AAC.1